MAFSVWLMVYNLVINVLCLIAREMEKKTIIDGVMYYLQYEC